VIRFVVRVAALLVLWLLAWGDISTANVLSGAAFGSVLVIAFPPRRRSAVHRLRPLGIVRLVLYVIGQLVVSNLIVARVILSRRSEVRTGVLAYHVQDASDQVLTLISNVIALTPGTMTVEVIREPPTIYVHFLLLDDPDSARDDIARLERLVVAALGPPNPVPSTHAERSQ
jgi:multicomponent Na+:H+ antiporter subunit E